MTLSTIEEIQVLAMSERDGADIWELVRQSGKLDLNSAYCYMMMGMYFDDTCAVAKLNGKAVGFVIGFRPPKKPDTWFVWQVGVAPEVRGRGIAGKLFEHVLNRPQNRDVRYIEATVTPSNKPSSSLFLGFARNRSLPYHITEGFNEDLFPESVHEKELLYRIGPIQNNKEDE